MSSVRLKMLLSARLGNTDDMPSSPPHQPRQIPKSAFRTISDKEDAIVEWSMVTWTKVSVPLSYPTFRLIDVRTRMGQRLLGTRKAPSKRMISRNSFSWENQSQISKETRNRVNYAIYCCLRFVVYTQSETSNWSELTRGGH